MQITRGTRLKAFDGVVLGTFERVNARLVVSIDTYVPLKYSVEAVEFINKVNRN